MKINEAWQRFFESFGMPAYRDTSVPDKDVSLPYLTYQFVRAEFNEKASITVKMWFYTESEAEPDEYADLLYQRLKNGGAKVLYDGGAVVFSPGSPFCIAQTGENDNNIKLRYFNITATYDQN